MKCIIVMYVRFRLYGAYKSTDVHNICVILTENYVITWSPPYTLTGCVTPAHAAPSMLCTHSMVTNTQYNVYQCCMHQ